MTSTVIHSLVVGLLVSCTVSGSEVFEAVREVSPDPIAPRVAERVPNPLPGNEAAEANHRPLGSAARGQSPGLVIGNTWYEQQQIGPMPRTVRWSPSPQPVMHFAWMRCPDGFPAGRAYAYAHYNFSNSVVSPISMLVPSGGYIDLAVTGDHRALIGGQWISSNPAVTQRFCWDSASAAGVFNTYDELPYELAIYAGDSFNASGWPKMTYVEGPDDTVLHVLSQTRRVSLYDPVPLVYFRRVGSENDPDAYWDYPPWIVDTIQRFSHTITSTDDGRVAMAWTASIPCSESDPDTASGYECRPYAGFENDLYFQTSDDNGVTWNNRVNLTNYIETEGDSGHYRADLSVCPLFDSDGSLHIVWTGREWPAEVTDSTPITPYRGAIFHWSETAPYIRTVHRFDWDQTICDGGFIHLNAAKATVSECNGRLYVVFVQFNDGPAGIYDDCSAPYSRAWPEGAANGDLYACVSDDEGLTWDPARNLTNSRSPGCDKVGGTGGPCESDHWVSMAPIGTSLGAGDPGAPVVVPVGGVDPGWYLDVFFVSDASAGSCYWSQGFETDSDMQWFRMACVSPVPSPDIEIAPSQITYPVYASHCTPQTTGLIIENTGNSDVDYLITPEEFTGPPGWLTVGSPAGTVPRGLANADTVSITVNDGGLVCSPGTIQYLSGRLQIQSSAPSSPDYVAVDILVADTIYVPEVDTIATNCLRLAALSDASFGDRGSGGVNLDFAAFGDCDPMAEVYLFDGSPVVGWSTPDDTVLHWSAYGGFPERAGLIPAGPGAWADSGDYTIAAARAVTPDCRIGVATDWIAPGSPDSCHFMIERIRYFATDGQSHGNLTLGEVLDWDIPSDSGTRNGAGSLAELDVIYQYGAEYHQDDTVLEPACQDSDSRFGAIRFLEMFRQNDSLQPLSATGGRRFHGAAVRAPDSDVHEGVIANVADLYATLRDTGISLYQSTDPDSEFVDLQTAISFVDSVDLGPGDTIIAYLAVMTVQNGDEQLVADYASQSRQWYCDHVAPATSQCSCCRLRGDVNGIEPVNVSDLTYLVNFLFKGGEAPACFDEGNADAEGDINIADLTYLVNFLFKGGPAPPPC